MKAGCRLCGGEVREFGAMPILGRHRGVYDLCGHCGLLQARDPFWLAESYQSAITRADLGTIQRCFQNGTAVRLVAGLRLRLAGPFLDYGAGYGALVRHLRDLGYDFHGYDRHCANLFAPDWEADPADGRRYQLTTAFEVFEHLVEPGREIGALWGRSERLLFSTEVMPDPPPPLGEWWYHAPHHGQHIAFYGRRTLEYLAASRGLRLSTDGRALHLIGPEAVPGWLLGLAPRRLGRLLAEWVVKPSLLHGDYQARLARLTASAAPAEPPPPPPS